MDGSSYMVLSSLKKESQAWIHGLLLSSLTPRVGNEVVRMAIGLRLGIPHCPPNSCCQCGARVDKFGRNGLSCHKEENRYEGVENLEEMD